MQSPTCRLHALLSTHFGTTTDLIDNELPAHLDKILATTQTFAIAKKITKKVDFGMVYLVKAFLSESAQIAHDWLIVPKLKKHEQSSS